MTADLWHLFTESARRTPTKPAVTGAQQLTYGELLDRAVTTAETIAPDAPAGSLLALAASGPVAGAVAMLAAARTGTSVLPLNMDSPPLHRQAVLADARPALVLTEAEDGRLVAERIERDARTLPGAAYVMYTSGSTGKPKGVVVPNRALADRLLGLARTPGLAAGESMLAMTALSFDISMAEILLPLVTGGVVVAAPFGCRQDPAIFAAFADATRPDVIQATPSFWRLALAWGWTGSPRSRLWCGGEALTQGLAGELVGRGAELWNLYGPTEATIWATAARIGPGRPVSLGEPLPGTGVCLVDGEIAIYGDGLAEGYLDRPELTASRFRRLVTPGGERLCYLTGDRGRLREDGGLEFLGRTDDQIKLRGHRIELGEIESVLEQCPGVSQAAAVVVRPENREPAIIAYAVTGDAVSAADLRRWIAQRLPLVMRPSRIHLVSELPRTTAGKVDRVRLAGR